MKKIMKKALSLLVVIAMLCASMTVFAADGSYENPYQLSASSVRFYVYLEAEETAYIQVDDCNNSVVNVGYATASTYMMQYGRQTIYPNQDATASFTMNPASAMFSVYNNGTEAISVYMSLTPGQAADTTGTMDDPEQVTLADLYGDGTLMAEFEKSLNAGNEGYFYTMTAPDEGAIIVSVSAYDDDWNPVGWRYNVNNITSGKYGDNINSVDNDGYMEVCPVTSGDKVNVCVSTFDPSNPWNNPAGNMYITLRFVTKGDVNYPDTINVGDNSTTIVNSVEHYYAWTATEDGNATVTMTSTSNWEYVVSVIPVDEEDYDAYYNGDYHVDTDEPVVSSETVPMYAGETILVCVNIPFDWDVFEGKSGTVNWTFAFEAGEVDKGNSGDQGGLGGDEDNYEISDTVLQVGDNPVTLGTYEWTLFEFTPDETGEYLFQTDDGVIGYWGAGTFFVQEPDESTLEGNLRATVTSVGQSVVVGITSVYGENTCNILITRVGDAEEEGGYDNNEYVNVVTPEEFTFPGNAETLLDSYVDTEDDTVDTAVPGDDGYYHLNSANGPVLFANLSDELLSLVNAQSFGQLSAVIYEEGVPVSITDFYNAFDKYVACADTESVEGATLYPLTEDLIAIFQLVGNDKGWYGEYGYLGGTEEDAWMFACYYDEAITSLAPATDGPATGGTTTGGTTTGGATTDSNASTSTPTTSTSAQTGDSTNVFLWVAVMMVGLAAVVVALKKRTR